MNKIPDGNKVTAKKANRGRPKTFDRNHIIDIAMMSYWKEGPIAVSINEICKRAGVSKPSVYREFGSEDGLKRAAVSTYCDLLIAQFERGMDLESNFVQILDSLIETTLQDRRGTHFPPGCLLVASSNCMGQLGAQTSETVRETRNIIIGKYERLIDRAKKNGEFKDDISTQLAAFYINEQIANAMIQQKRGERAEDIRDNLKLALSVFI